MAEQDYPEIKEVTLDSNAPPPAAYIFFGGNEFVTYHVYVSDSLSEYGQLLGKQDNRKFDEEDVFPLGLEAKDLKGKYLMVNGVFRDPGSGKVDSYHATIGVTQSGDEVTGSPAKWENGKLNGKKHDSRRFIIKFL